LHACPDPVTVHACAAPAAELITSHPVMSPTEEPTPEDIELFRRSVGPVRRLCGDKIQHAGRRPAPRPGAARPFEPQRQPSDFPQEFHGREIGAGESVHFARSGLQHRLLQRLRRGQLPCEAELDLHSLTVAQAHQAITRFLADCGEQGIRSVRVIHGKGYGSRERAPVLKSRLNHWLREHPEVLAFCSSRPDQGGTGAVNVLLRSRR
jgi:DNA-nicking Smr family endonuclease